ncbi:roadblock/LC7 domain-containing protein [Streptantibioticus parmotrematis]|uniref:roadblock/LC7 domain-containing protein n=1 Tax=Streptantibioticus parmotrematis TaxID=2873249 RepID=UPI0033E1588E
MRRVLRARPERGLPVVEAALGEELRRLRARVPSLTGSVVAASDGLVLARDLATGDADGTAALTAAAMGVAVRMSDDAGHGALRELLVHGEDGYVACYRAGSAAVLTVLAQARINVGRLHLESRAASGRIGRLVDVATRDTPAPFQLPYRQR